MRDILKYIVHTLTLFGRGKEEAGAAFRREFDILTESGSSKRGLVRIGTTAGRPFEFSFGIGPRFWPRSLAKRLEVIVATLSEAVLSLENMVIVLRHLCRLRVKSGSDCDQGLDED